jgi:hypothetical protein
VPVSSDMPLSIVDLFQSWATSLLCSARTLKVSNTEGSLHAAVITSCQILLPLLLDRTCSTMPQQLDEILGKDTEGLRGYIVAGEGSRAPPREAMCQRLLLLSLPGTLPSSC